MAKATAAPHGATTPMSPTKTALILVASIGGTVAGLVAFLWYAMPATDTVVSGHGTTAMVLGVAFSLIVGIGLMALVFYSSRLGYDEDVTIRRRVDRVTAPGE